MRFDLKLDIRVPHLLTDRNKIKRISAAVSLLGRLKNEPFLDQLVTGDEKWVLYNNVQCKRTWKQVGEHGDTMAKTSLHPMKVMLCVCWDCKGIIYFEFLPAGQTIDLDQSPINQSELRNQKKRPILSNRKGVVFHHDNARPHVSRQTLRKLNSLKWDVLTHPPYSSDIAPSDYHLFWSLQNHLNGEKIDSLDALKKVVSSFFKSKTCSFYDRGIPMLPECWKQIVENDGEYIIDWIRTLFT